MTMTEFGSPPTKTRKHLITLLILAALTTLGLLAIFYHGIVFLAEEWDSDQYSHGALIPIVSAVIIWLKRHELSATPRRPSWVGLVILVPTLAIALIGQLATINLLLHLSLVFSIIGLVIAFLGLRVAGLLWFPLIYLFFMIPLPDFLQVKLSGQLQLLSSSLGVSFIRLFDISVFREGNIIDLGDFKMQVVEACNGLRYIFPLMSFGILVAYLYNGPFWQRVLLFVSTIPIAVLMNSMRIGIIGILHELYGINAASGFLHDFEGWAVFGTCLALLLIELKLLSYLNPVKKPFLDYFSVTTIRQAHS
jgi:exosortase D (VPLPA-CTERM-specific)